MTVEKAIEEVQFNMSRIGLGARAARRVKEAKEMAIEALKKVQAFEAIGTIDEFKALKQKNTPYKPNEYEDRYYACKCDNILLPKWKKYPTILMPKSEGLPHCMACGQKLDWSE